MITGSDEPTCPGKDGQNCCGCMIHNSWTEAWECGCAYLALSDDGVLVDGLAAVEDAAMTPAQRRYLSHWRQHRVPDAALTAVA